MIINYFTYPITTTITDTLLTDQEITNNFMLNSPDSTFCNLNPFRSDYETVAQNESIPSISDYLAQVEMFKQTDEMTHDIFANKLNSLMGYYQYIGFEKAAKLSHSADDSLVDCKIVVHSTLGFDTIPCNREKQSVT